MQLSQEEQEERDEIEQAIEAGQDDEDDGDRPRLLAVRDTNEWHCRSVAFLQARHAYVNEAVKRSRPIRLSHCDIVTRVDR